MGNIVCKKWFTIIRRHFFIILFKLLKFVLVLLVAIFLYWFYVNYIFHIEDIQSIKIVYIWLLIWIINYIFLSLILALIKYYYNLIIIYDNKIVIIKCSLLYKDDLEFIDAYRIMKFDSFQRWFVANIFSFWDLIIEQQKNDVRVFHYIPDPHKIISILNIQRDNMINLRRNND